MTPSTSAFVTIIELPVGVHQYKFVVDGDWLFDPTQKVDNDVNVIQVDATDRDPFDALDVDTRIRSFVAESEDGFGQELPPTNSGGKACPPVLPPHLLQVILNKDTPLVCEPTLLPTPNHVMVNHAYALSIKDKVIVMSCTSRFKKKYVTTVLYKPIP